MQLIRDEIRAGKSDKDIYKKLEDDFGETVLYTPKFDYQTAALWLSPVSKTSPRKKRRFCLNWLFLFSLKPFSYYCLIIFLATAAVCRRCFRGMGLPEAQTEDKCSLNGLESCQRCSIDREREANNAWSSHPTSITSRNSIPLVEKVWRSVKVPRNIVMAIIKGKGIYGFHLFMEQ